MDSVFYLLHQCQAALATTNGNSTSLVEVGIAAGATLGGAALGAWLGARGAYRATAKAGFDLVQRQKLEEAITELHRMRQDESPRMVQVVVTLREKGSYAAYEAAKANGIDLSFGFHFPLLTTIEIYFEEGYDDAVRIRDAMMDFGSVVHQLSEYEEDAKSEIKKMEDASRKFRDAHSCLLDKLMSALKKTP
ncbi:hypothetical protein [Halomonas salinarum]|uniref:hypothetical protein n=1 Tax=Halomonas salinarum TaxID=1158993 RepID=UPI00143BA1AE|nr:hypothetical protein [Halomonas salinarum]